MGQSLARSSPDMGEVPVAADLAEVPHRGSVCLVAVGQKQFLLHRLLGVRNVWMCILKSDYIRQVGYSPLSVSPSILCRELACLR